jgi:hypothetical protein
MDTKIVAQETAHPRPSDQARSVDGWHFFGDSVRFSLGRREALGHVVRVSVAYPDCNSEAARGADRWRRIR